MNARYKRYVLDFKRPSGTSRGVINQKETWFLILEDHGNFGIGECGLLRGLSIDDVPDYEDRLKWVCDNISRGLDYLWNGLLQYPSLQFGVEQAFISLRAKEPFQLYPSSFTKGLAPIPINGLVWMGDVDFMQEQIAQKLEEGFHCIKMKIGAIDFKSELTLLASIRKKYNRSQIELRVDANGGFTTSDALEKLKLLAELDIHSIEQPIPPGHWRAMAELCQKSPIPIALDEELIGIFEMDKKQQLLQTIHPQFLILKPSLVGGYKGSEEWISLAEKQNIGWWVTSALESNIGLNAIAQWTYTLNNPLPQGLGTGSLFTNNLDSPLKVENGKLFYEPAKIWNIDLITQLCI